MIDRLPLSAHTSYAELMERLRLARLGEFPAGAAFVSKRVKGRLYWYVQMPTGGADARKQLYVGPDSEALRERMSAHAEIRADAADRRSLVAAILASGAPRPDRLTAEIVQALADAGAFRLRAMLVGTVAFQTYAAHLGMRLPASGVGTQDLDLAQDFGIASAVDDALPASLFEVLPMLKSYAVPLQYMDFLLRDPIETAVLHGAGVLVNAPAPARYAVHKLIVSRDRKVNPEKGRKDLLQAAHLIEALAQEDPFALRDAYAEARGRGPSWRELLDQAVSMLPEAARAALA